MHYHAIALLPGGRKKSLVNKSEQTMLTDVVIPYVSNGVVEAKWGNKNQSYQVIELRIYKTKKAWDKKTGKPLEHFTAKSRNIYSGFESKAQKVLGANTPRVFIIMPIQGERFGGQNEQRIFQEYDDRFETLEKLVGSFDCVAIRIDKEHPMQDLVNRIKDEIKKAKFVIADLSDERPSCYFEAGYAEALKIPVIYIASKESVIVPGQKTKIHFDVHMNVNFFVNQKELRTKVKDAIKKNWDYIFAQSEPQKALAKAE